MKKNYIFLILTMLSIFFFIPKKDNFIIPKDSIRFRVISNSNQPEDIITKNKVRDNVQQELIKILADVKDINSAKETLGSNLKNINNIVKRTLKSDQYNINLGLNYFPDKIYKNVKYEEGLYESLVITIDEGRGDNWWCVLFPPLCLLEAEETNMKKVEYKFFVKEIVKKYLNK